MPWTAKDASAKTKKANTPTAKRQWAAVANSAKARGADDESAIRQASAVVAKRKKPATKKPSGS